MDNLEALRAAVEMTLAIYVGWQMTTWLGRKRKKIEQSRAAYESACAMNRRRKD